MLLTVMAKRFGQACWSLTLAAVLGGLTGCDVEVAGTGSALSPTDSAQFAIDLDYSREEMFDFSIELYLQDHAAHLLPRAEEISHVAGEYRISPRALIALMEQQSGAVDDPDFTEARPLGDLSVKNGFVAQLRDLCSRLRALPETTDLRIVLGVADSAISTVLPSGDLLGLGEIYRNLFPGVVSRPNLLPKATGARVPMQFPWPVGESWIFGTAHANDDSTSTLSSIDFMQPGSQLWGSPIHAKVVASAAGRLKRHSRCYVSIEHGNDWSTGYYHLSDITVVDGANVQANQPFAKYATTQSPGLCNEGTSTGPHLHWTVYQGNRPVRLNGSVLSGWTVHPGIAEQDETCTSMYLLRDTEKACAWSAVLNDGVVTGGEY